MTQPPLDELVCGGCWEEAAEDAAPLPPLRLELDPDQILEMVFFRNPPFCDSTASSAISTSSEWWPLVPAPVR